MVTRREHARITTYEEFCMSLVPQFPLGSTSRHTLTWAFDRVAQSLRLFLMNSDESGSMEGSLHFNAMLFEHLVGLCREWDAVIAHGFGSDSAYVIFATAAAAQHLETVLGDNLDITFARPCAGSAAEVVVQARAHFAKQKTHGSTCPKSHPRFLGRLAAALDKFQGTVSLTVASSSDGGFDGGSPQQAIRDEMLRLTSRCRCQVAANVLVGSNGSPEALHFFTGDASAFADRLLFSTQQAAEGVLHLQQFDPKSVAISEAGGDAQMVFQPAPMFWMMEDENSLLIYWPETVTPPEVLTVRHFQPQPGGRELVMSATTAVALKPVRMDEDARAVMTLIAERFCDNPFMRDDARAALNALLARLETLQATRAQVLMSITAKPGEMAASDALRAQLAEIRAHMQTTLTAPATLRERSARINTLNNALRHLKSELRQETQTIQQRALEREEVYLRAHPDHWVVWLQPVIEIIQAQLNRTQQPVGDAMRHLSTQIRTKKSREDGQQRAVDRHIDRLLARSRDRYDRAERRIRPENDRLAFETPAAWLEGSCPIADSPLNQGVIGLPFVADRRDITSGNVASGGQNVDRIPISRDAFLSLRAVRELMWDFNNGQMASPFATPRGFYNAVIPVLVGPASPATVRSLEKAIGWLCTGTSAFEAPMAEAVPAALAVILGAPDDDANNSADNPQAPALPSRLVQAHALLRTTALFDRFWSYPYVANTSVLDESDKKIPLPEVWARSLTDSGDLACLQNSGCVSSLLAKAVGARPTYAIDAVIRGMFAWCCRNIARAILSGSDTDGRGGLEGARRLAALLFYNIDLAQHPSAPSKTAQIAQPEQEARDMLNAADISDILGPDLSHLWAQPQSVRASDFMTALNNWMNRLPPASVVQVIHHLPAILMRLDARTPPAPAPAAIATQHSADAQTHISGDVHQHFDIPSLEALSPQRFTSPMPDLADENLTRNRILKAGEVSWVPPADARLPEGIYNASALAYLNAHSAMYPLRALLRLHAANMLGLDRLKALRQESTLTPIPRVDDVFAALAPLMGGMDEVVRVMLRAFAFVVDNAFSYADKQWAESNLRTANHERVASILRLPSDAPCATPVHYKTARWSIPAAGPTWPQMIGLGYLPKSRVVNRKGETIGTPFVCGPEARTMTDAELCHLGCAQVIAQVSVVDGREMIEGLHRSARAVLGEHPEDLRQLSPAALQKVMQQSLIPKLAGRVRGDQRLAVFFTKCAMVLRQMIDLGEDTRNFRAEEPLDWLRHQADEIRARVA